LISDALPFGALWYGEAGAVSDMIGYAKLLSGIRCRTLAESKSSRMREHVRPLAAGRVRQSDGRGSRSAHGRTGYALSRPGSILSTWCPPIRPNELAIDEVADLE